MKKHLIIVMLLATVLFGCKKDDTTSPDLFAENEALIKPEAKIYLICDVVGFDGLEKINIQMVNMNSQSVDNTCSYAYGNQYSSPGYYMYGSYCRNLYNDPGTDLEVGIYIRGKYPATFDNIVKPGVQSIRGENDSTGAEVSFRYMLEDLFHTKFAPSGDNFLEIMSVEKNKDEWPSGAEWPGPSHFIKVHFNCKLASANGDTIRLENAVYRSAIDE